MTKSKSAETKPQPVRVVLVGCGGTGSWLAEGIVRMLEFERPGSVLMLIDGDSYEHKNAARQSFTELGNKAEVKAAELAPLFPRTFVVASPRWVVDDIEGDTNAMTDFKITAARLLEEGDAVFAMVDNFACRKSLFDAAAALGNVDVFTGGNDDQYYGSLYHYCRRNGADLTDHPAEYHAEYDNPPDRNPGALSCEERMMLEGGTQLVSTNMAVAAWTLAKFHRHLRGIDPIAASEIYFDLGAGMASSFARDAALVDENEAELIQAAG